MRKRFFICCNIVMAASALSQGVSSAEIYERIKKLNVLGSVLYIAAHPDDENTRLLCYLSKSQHLRTAYLSLTRGDGGQNLIGQELDEFLGVIRTQELAEARKIDGATQYFSRANDFGYSKNAEETLETWNKQEILFDMIKTIREFKPDVIINRFDHRESGKTHGHHTASAILSLEALRLAYDSQYESEALKDYPPHKAQKMYFNTSWFFWGSREKFAAADKSHLFSLDIGEYYNAYGFSNNEISAKSRSMHKSQGFGISSSRGKMIEYFERIDTAGIVGNLRSPFEGMDFSWNRCEGGHKVKKIIDQAISTYQLDKPWLSIGILQQAEQLIKELEPSHWRDVKLKEIQQVIVLCCGLYTEATTDQLLAAPGQTITVNTECIVRNPVPCILKSIQMGGRLKDTAFYINLPYNVSQFWKTDITIPKESEFTSAFWLLKGKQNGHYLLENVLDANKLENDRRWHADFIVEINGIDYPIKEYIDYKHIDPVKGEIRQNLDIIPPVYLWPVEEVFVADNKKTAKVKLTVHSILAQQQVTISLGNIAGVKIHPALQTFRLDSAQSKRELHFTLQFDKIHDKPINIPVEINGSPAYSLKTIKYDHIRWQHVLLPAKVKAVCTTMKGKKKRIWYIEGAGDYVDEALMAMGHDVRVVRPSELAQLTAKKTDAVVFGIRSLNVVPELKDCKSHLMRFMMEGGKVIFQYNTTSELVTTDFGPMPFMISRERVTDENAPLTFLEPSHPVLRRPCKITAADFDNWVQERGLYFPEAVHPSYQKIFHVADPKEKGSSNSLLIKKVGKGYFVYCALAFFRQLPAAVPGAYRMFNNIIGF